MVGRGQERQDTELPSSSSLELRQLRMSQSNGRSVTSWIVLMQCVEPP